MKTWGILLKRAVPFTIVMPLVVMAYSDADFDGVSDAHDLCPNSSMTDIVDQTGCTVEKLIAPTTNADRFDIILGLNQSRNSETSLNQSLQIDYYHKNLTLQLQTANYVNGGQGDTTIGLFYRFKPMEKLSLSLGASAILPTYESDLDNNNMDYKLSASLNYPINKFSLFLGGSYTLVNDDDINGSNYNVSYQNSQNFYLGIGKYLLPKLYSSVIYSDSSSIYEGGDHSSSLSLYNHYIINPNWFTRFGYTQGLSDTASNQLYLSVGYYF